MPTLDELKRRGEAANAAIACGLAESHWLSSELLRLEKQAATTYREYEEMVERLHPAHQSRR